MESGERLRLLEAAVEQSSDAVLITDADLDDGPTILYANPAFQEMSGYDWEELAGATPRILQGPATDRVLMTRLRAALTAGDTFEGETTNYRKDGQPYQVEWRISPVRAEAGGAITHFVSVQRDVTERDRRDKQMQLLSTAVEESADPLLITDAEGSITYVNRAFERQTGYSREEVLGGNPRLLKSGYHDEAFYQSLWETITSGETFRATFTERARDGSLFYQEQTITPVRGADGAISHFVSTGKDISDRVRMERELKRLATTDPLTDLYNRLRFEQLLDEELERVRRYQRDLALIMFDVDHFKAVNDRFGHDTGDRILQGLAGVVREHLRTPDVFARWGGEEFMILAPETGARGACDLAERLRTAIAATDFSEVGTVTASFGVTLRAPEDTIKQLIKRVDQALYRAKEHGRNRVEAL
jgi:diguanylate cyclase (GGDEF)-like protein/PAS domain S-box-containing protein